MTNTRLENLEVLQDYLNRPNQWLFLGGVHSMSDTLKKGHDRFESTGNFGIQNFEEAKNVTVEWYFRVILDSASNRGRLENALKLLCIDAIKVEKYLVIHDVRLTASSVRSLLEHIGLYRRGLKRLDTETDLGKFKKAPQKFDSKRMVNLGLQISDETVSWLLKGSIDIWELKNTGKLKVASKNKYRKPPEDIKKIADAVKKLKHYNFSEDIDLSYKLLSELVHPALSNASCNIDNEESRIFFGYAFKQYQFQTDDTVLHPYSLQIRMKIGEFYDELLEVIKTLILETENMANLLAIFSKHLTKSKVEELISNHHPEIVGTFFQKLETNKYEPCICMSGIQYKHCCRDELQAMRHR